MAPQDEPDDDRIDWAEDRTRWAEDRTLFASERTFAGWTRTGLTAVAVALGLHAVFGVSEPPWAPKAVATLFLVAALVVFVAAWREARASRSRLSSHDVQPQPAFWTTALTVLLSIGTVGIGVVLWAL